MLVVQHLNQSKPEQRRNKLTDLTNPVRLAAEAMIDGRLRSMTAMAKTTAPDMVSEQALENNVEVRGLVKNLFPPTTPVDGALPHTPITLSALFQGLTIYKSTEY